MLFQEVRAAKLFYSNSPCKEWKWIQKSCIKTTLRLWFKWLGSKDLLNQYYHSSLACFTMFRHSALLIRKITHNLRVKQCLNRMEKAKDKKAAFRSCNYAGFKIRPLILFKSFFFVFIKIHTLAKCMAHWAVHKTHTSLQHQIPTIQNKLLI